MATKINSFKDLHHLTRRFNIIEDNTDEITYGVGPTSSET